MLFGLKSQAVRQRWCFGVFLAAVLVTARAFQAAASADGQETEGPEVLHKHSHLAFPEAELARQQRQDWSPPGSLIEFGVCWSLDGPTCLSGVLEQQHMAGVTLVAEQAGEGAAAPTAVPRSLGRSLQHHIEQALDQAPGARSGSPPEAHASAWTGRPLQVGSIRDLTNFEEVAQRLQELDSIVEGLALSRDLPIEGVVLLADSLRQRLAVRLTGQQGAAVGLLKQLQAVRTERRQGRVTPPDNSALYDDYEDYATPVGAASEPEPATELQVGVVVEAVAGLLELYLTDLNNRQLEDEQTTVQTRGAIKTSNSILLRLREWDSWVDRLGPEGRAKQKAMGSAEQVVLERAYAEELVWEDAAEAVMLAGSLDGGWAFLEHVMASHPMQDHAELSPRQHAHQQWAASGAAGDGQASALEQSNANALPDEEGGVYDEDLEDFTNWSPEDMQAMLDYYNDAYNDTLSAWPDYSDAVYV